MGQEVAELEQKLSEFCGVNHTISCGNGTDAIMISLMALGVEPGDLIATTPFSFFATAEAICILGARPVFVDIDIDTYNMCPDELQRTMEKQANTNPIKAVISVDLFGQPCDYDRIEMICKSHGAALLTDSAQSFGSQLGARKTGSFGDIASTSFFPSKPLGCYGDGGAILTNSDLLALETRSIRSHGKGVDKYDNRRIGVNSRLDTIQAAILLSKLQIFEDEVRLRNKVAQYYSENITNDYFFKQKIIETSTSVWAQYCLRAVSEEDRAEIINRFKSKDIPAQIYYKKCLHLQPAVSYLGYVEGDFPNAETVSKTIFSIPMHPYLDSSDQDQVIEILQNYGR